MIRIHNYGQDNWKQWESFYNQEHQRYNIRLKDGSYSVAANKKYSPYLNAKEDIDVGFTTISKINKYLMLNVDEKEKEEDILFISIAVEKADDCKITFYESKLLYKDIHFSNGLQVITIIAVLEHCFGFVDLQIKKKSLFIPFTLDNLEIYHQPVKKYKRNFNRLYSNVHKRIVTQDLSPFSKILTNRSSFKKGIIAEVEKARLEKMAFCRELKKTLAKIKEKAGFGVSVNYGISTVEVNGKKYYYHLENLQAIKARLSHIVKYPAVV